MLKLKLMLLPESHGLIESSYVNPDEKNPRKVSISMKAEGCSNSQLQEINRRYLPPLLRRQLPLLASM